MVIDTDLVQLVSMSEMKSGNNYGTGMLLVHPETRKLLLGRRTDTHNMCSPGGKVEVGESPLQGVVRETLEEANVQVTSVKFYDYEMHTAENGKNWTSFMFYSDDFDPSTIKNQESEVEPWDWYTLDEALDMDLFPPTRKSIERAIEAGLFEEEDYDVNIKAPMAPLHDLAYPKHEFIPFVEVPTSPFMDTCPCAYTYCKPDEIFG